MLTCLECASMSLASAPSALFYPTTFEGHSSLNTGYLLLSGESTTTLNRLQTPQNASRSNAMASKQALMALTSSMPIHSCKMSTTSCDRRSRRTCDACKILRMRQQPIHKINHPAGSDGRSIPLLWMIVPTPPESTRSSLRQRRRPLCVLLKSVKTAYIVVRQLCSSRTEWASMKPLSIDSSQIRRADKFYHRVDNAWRVEEDGNYCCTPRCTRWNW